MDQGQTVSALILPFYVFAEGCSGASTGASCWIQEQEGFATLHTVLVIY
jgi:hypothetical protein